MQEELSFRSSQPAACLTLWAFLGNVNARPAGPKWDDLQLLLVN